MDLSLVPTDDLIKVLVDRFDHMIFMGLKETSKVDKQYKRRWAGSDHICMGLCADISSCIYHDLSDREQPIEPGDD